jgi:hypothetical protein
MGMATTETPTPTPTFDELIGEVIPLFAECGFFSTDDIGEDDLPAAPAWLAQAHEAFMPHRLGCIAANSHGDELNLLVLTSNGVVLSHARFDITEVGFLMFAGAVDALSEES